MQNVTVQVLPLLIFYIFGVTNLFFIFYFYFHSSYTCGYFLISVIALWFYIYVFIFYSICCLLFTIFKGCNM